MLTILDRLLQRLASAGIMAMLGIHTLSEPEKNNPLWCEASSCNTANGAPLLQAWSTLAERHCKHPNVIAADLFNEPYQATWGVGRPDTDWGLAASRIGNHVQSRCARWLIVTQGVGNNQGQCKESASQSTCWWDENLVSQITHPIMLRDQSKLVLSP
jgi:endoglucanase